MLKIISLAWILILILVLDACNKENKQGSITVKDIEGEWRLISRFWDLDSNGLDSGDKIYMQPISDTFIWKLNPNNKVEYIIDNKLNYSGYWYLTWPNQPNGMNEVLLYPDPDLENHVFKIQMVESKKMNFYCKRLRFKFGVRTTEWWGWQLERP